MLHLSLSCPPSGLMAVQCKLWLGCLDHATGQPGVLDFFCTKHRFEEGASVRRDGSSLRALVQDIKQAATRGAPGSRGGKTFEKLGHGHVVQPVRAIEDNTLLC